MEIYIIFNVDGKCIRHGKVDKNEKPDGSTVFENVKEVLAEDNKYKIAYFPLGTEFDPLTQKIINKKIVAKTAEEIETENEIRAARQLIMIRAGAFNELKLAKNFSEFIEIFKTIEGE